jgi:glycosyltransferase involved in cell wall biosynthesis
LKRDEIRLAEFADSITYVTADDMQYFSEKLKAQHHLTLATLAPRSERALLQMSAFPNVGGDERIDFLYVGNNNPGNERSVVWLLTEVVPLLGNSYSIAIVGSIARHLKATNPDFFHRFERHFVGEVPDVIDYYRRALVVVAPARFGTGTSIKMIEALAAGKPIVGTSGAFRGLPQDAASAAVRMSDDPAGFAAAMVDTHGNARELSSLSRQLYIDHLSNEKYFERWDRVLTGVGMPRDPTKIGMAA